MMDQTKHKHMQYSCICTIKNIFPTFQQQNKNSCITNDIINKNEINIIINF